MGDEKVMVVGKHEIMFKDGKTYARLTKDVKVGTMVVNEWIEIKPGESLSNN